MPESLEIRAMKCLLAVISGTVMTVQSHFMW
jgi:hypothetical protein